MSYRLLIRSSFCLFDGSFEHVDRLPKHCIASLVGILLGLHEPPKHDGTTLFALADFPSELVDLLHREKVRAGKAKHMQQKHVHAPVVLLGDEVFLFGEGQRNGDKFFYTDCFVITCNEWFWREEALGYCLSEITVKKEEQIGKPIEPEQPSSLSDRIFDGRRSVGAAATTT